MPALDPNNITIIDEPVERTLNPANITIDDEQPEDVKQKLVLDRDDPWKQFKTTGRVSGYIASTLALMPGAGIRAAIDLIPTISTDPDKIVDLGSIEKANKRYQDIMQTPENLIETPQEAEAIERIAIATKPFEMAGEGWRMIAYAINKGLDYLGLPAVPYLEPIMASGGEAAAIFAAPNVVKTIKNSTAFRRLTVPERGIVLQSLAEAKKANPSMTEGELLRRYVKGEPGEAWFEEARKATIVRPKVSEPMLKPENIEVTSTPEEISELSRRKFDQIVAERLDVEGPRHGYVGQPSKKVGETIEAYRERVGIAPVEGGEVLGNTYKGKWKADKKFGIEKPLYGWTEGTTGSDFTTETLDPSEIAEKAEAVRKRFAGEGDLATMTKVGETIQPKEPIEELDELRGVHNRLSPKKLGQIERSEIIEDPTTIKKVKPSRAKLAERYNIKYKTAATPRTNAEYAAAKKDLGPVIKQRVTYREKATGERAKVLRPPVFRDEFLGIQSMNELPGYTLARPLGGWLETGPRTFDQIGPFGKEFYYRTMLKAFGEADKAKKASSKRFINIKKSLPSGAGDRIGIYGISKELRGPDILANQGDRVIKLSDAEMKAYSEIRRTFDTLYNQLNKARRLAGKEPIPKQPNYITFMRKARLVERMGFSFEDMRPDMLNLSEKTLAGLEKLGFHPKSVVKVVDQLKRKGMNPDTTPISEYAKQFIKMKATPFKYAKARAKAGTMPVETDIFLIMDRYMDAAYKHIHLSPAISKLRETLGLFKNIRVGGKGKWQIKDVVTGEIYPEVYKTAKEADKAISNTAYSLFENKPKTAKFISDWLDDAAGQRVKSAFLPVPLEKMLTRLNENMLYAYLSYSIRSTAIQPTALRGTVVELGLPYTAKGISAMADPKNIKFAFENSNHLSSRQFDAMLEDMVSAIKHGKIGELERRAGKFGLRALQFLDVQTAVATWLGAHEYAKANLGLAGEQACNFADDLVIKTQASGARIDRSPAQRTLEGRLLTMFQTFNINEWGWLVRDVMGIGNPDISNTQALKGMISVLFWTTLVNMFYEDVLDMNSSFPTPIRAYRYAKELGKDAAVALADTAYEILQQVPLFSGLRYRSGVGGPALETVTGISLAVPDLSARFFRVLTKLEWGEPISYTERKGIESVLKAAGFPATSQGARSYRAYLRGETPYGVLVGSYTPPSERKKRGMKPRGELKVEKRYYYGPKEKPKKRLVIGGND